MRDFFSKYGGNVAGWVWNAGNAAQFLLGAITWTPLVILASAMNIGSACCWSALGHKNWGTKLACILSILGTAVTVRESLLEGDLGVWAAFVVFTVALGFSYYGDRLEAAYGNDANALKRKTLGRPRRVTGLTNVFLSRIPIIITNAMAARWDVVIPFVLWMIGDFIFSLSAPEKKEPELVPLAA